MTFRDRQQEELQGSAVPDGGTGGNPDLQQRRQRLEALEGVADAALARVEGVDPEKWLTRNVQRSSQ